MKVLPCEAGIKARESRAGVISLTVSGQVGPLLVLQKNSGQSYSIALSWNPKLALYSLIALEGSFGISFLKSSDTNSLFLVGQFGTFLSVDLSYVTLGLGGGMETWVNNGGTNLFLGAFLARELHLELYRKISINRVFFAYSRLFGSTAPANEFKLGIGIGI